MTGTALTQWAGNGVAGPEPGQSCRDPVGGAVLLVLTAPRWPGVLRCNGVTMVLGRPLSCSYHSRTGISAALRPGRRYRDPASGLEVCCLRGGNGRLTYARASLIAVIRESVTVAAQAVG
jgi:hypothetical protein